MPVSWSSVPTVARRPSRTIPTRSQVCSPAAELRKLARHVADALLHRDRVAVGIEAEDRRRAARRVAQAHEQLDRGGLPGAVRTEEPEDLALGDVQVQIEDPSACAVVLGELLGVDSARSVAHDTFPRSGRYTRLPRTSGPAPGELQRQRQPLTVPGPARPRQPSWGLR